MAKFGFLLLIILVLRLMIFYSNPPKVTNIYKNPVRQTSIFTNIKDKIRDVYAQNLNSREANLLMGIVFGEKNLDKESNEAFKNTGVLHVVAASGMNVSMLVSFLLVTFVIFLRRQHALILTFLAILFYTALADFQPSIVRAAIMSGFALAAGLVGRQNTSLLAPFLAAFVMVFWDPEIITSVGFILSFAATAGIILLDPVLKKKIKSDLLEDFRTTIAAQLATTPIILFFFGTYSAISIPTNFLVLWTVPPLMALGGVGALLGLITPILSAPFVLLCLPLLLYFRAVVEYFAMASSPVEIKSIPWTLVAGYYLILLALIVLLRKRLKIAS